MVTRGFSSPAGASCARQTLEVPNKTATASVDNRVFLTFRSPFAESGYSFPPLPAPQPGGGSGTRFPTERASLPGNASRNQGPESRSMEIFRPALPAVRKYAMPAWHRPAPLPEGEGSPVADGWLGRSPAVPQASGPWGFAGRGRQSPADWSSFEKQSSSTFPTPPPGSHPSPVSGRPNWAFSDAMRISQASASSRPPPRA